MPGKLGNLSDRKMKPPIYELWSGFGLSQIEQKRNEPGSDSINSGSTFLAHERSKLNHVDDLYNHISNTFSNACYISKTYHWRIQEGVRTPVLDKCFVHFRVVFRKT